MISIVTITFNNYEELLSTINSVAPVLSNEIEHIVINGGSCQETQKYLESEFKGRFISEPDNGIADAFNKGWRYSRSKYICFINSGDSLIDKNYFKNVSARLKEDIDLVCCDLIHRIHNVGDVYKSSLMCFPNMPYNHQGLILKRQFFEDVRGFDESYKVAMDFDLLAKIFSKGRPSEYHYKHAVILMDAQGISHVRNDLGIREKYISLKKNGILTNYDRIMLWTQLFKALVKRVLIKLKLNFLVELYKKWKNPIYKIK